MSLIRLSKIHIMIDLETMGVENDAAIISLGAVKFDPRGDGVLDAFYSRVDLNSALKAGMSVSGSTIDWWLKDDLADARRALKSSEPMALWEVLTGFIDWYEREVPETEGFDGDRRTVAGVWGNGATFDNVILRSAYKLANLDCPWSFRQDRCYRTLKSLAQLPVETNVGTLHHALDDATAQAMHMQALCEHLGIDP